MQLQKRYEVLDGLPTYGPMYIPVSETDEAFYSEGFVVRFHKSDGTEWVANFKSGWGDLCLIIDYPNTNRTIVVAYGQGYIMSPDQEKPIDTFGVDIKEAISTTDNKIIFIDNVRVRLVDENGSLWESERISWDGFKDLKLRDHILEGLSFYPMDSNNEWIPFSLDLNNKEIKGGSYRLYF